MDALNNQYQIFPDSDAVFHAAAKDLLTRSTKAVKKRGEFNLVLSGGNTPKQYFNLLANTAPYRNTIPWGEIHFYFGDERYLPPEDDNNNYRMAMTYLLSKLPIPAEHIHRIPTTEYPDPQDAAAQYVKTIADVQFDLIYLGLGDNSHTASLMPNTEIVEAYATDALSPSEKASTVALWVAELDMYRLTLTPPAINACDCIQFLVVGEEKAQAVWNVTQGPQNPIEYPAQLIQSIHGETQWFLDQAAASKIQDITHG